MPTHEAGWAHADGALRGPSWLREPRDPNALVPGLWSTTSHKVDGNLVVGGVSLPELVADVNTPAYVLDEADFRSRARAFRQAFAAYDVFYAGKAFLCTTVAPGSATTATPRPSPSYGEPSPRAWVGSSSTRSTRSSGWSA